MPRGRRRFWPVGRLAPQADVAQPCHGRSTGSIPVIRSTSGVPMRHRPRAGRGCGRAGCARAAPALVQRVTCARPGRRASRAWTQPKWKQSSPGDGTGRHACLRHRILGVRVAPGAPIKERWPSGPRQRLAKPWSRRPRPAGSNPARSARSVHGLAQSSERVLWEHETEGSRPSTVTMPTG